MERRKKRAGKGSRSGGEMRGRVHLLDEREKKAVDQDEGRAVEFPYDRGRRRVCKIFCGRQMRNGFHTSSFVKSLDHIGQQERRFLTARKGERGNLTSNANSVLEMHEPGEPS